MASREPSPSWEQQLGALWDDLEAQADDLFTTERALEVADRSRAEYARVTLASRVMASVDREVVLHVTGLGRVPGRVRRVGTGWCLVAQPGQEWLVRLAAVTRVDGISARSVAEAAWPHVARLGLGSVLRRLADAGETCRLHLVDGAALELRPTRVGADFVEGTLGERGETAVAFAALAAVQRRVVTG